jgi:sugar phosphate isomerase/epimerase
MRLAATSDSFPLLPHEVAIELIAGLGFDAHDLMLFGNRSEITPQIVREDVGRWAGLIAERGREHGLPCTDVFVIPWTDFRVMAANHPDPEEVAKGRALFEDMVDFTARLGAPGFTMLPGADWPDEDHDTSLARAAAELGRRAEYARERGVRFSIEPHVGGVCATPADALALCGAAPGLELTLDAAHFTSEGDDFAAIAPLLPHTRHVHARGATKELLQAPLKDSTVDFEAFVDALQAADYDGAITVEYAWSEWGGLNKVDVASELVMLRARLSAKLAGEPWEYPRFGWPMEALEA